MTADECIEYDKNGNYVHHDDCECWCHWAFGGENDD